MARMTAIEGDFVRIDSARHAHLGVGKLVRLFRGQAIVQYFDVPGGDQPKPVICSSQQLRLVRLSPQTRVWRTNDSGHWEAGRVLQDEGDAVFVEFVGRAYPTLPKAQLQVRWDAPLSDPLALLCAETTESPLLANTRSDFLRETAVQYAAAHGLPAVLSASVEVVAYQFEVVRRVLSDPMPRYLLADEVGLGKTIEAGLILRQHFLDGDRAHAVVLVPAPLVAQWRAELSQRFGLGDLLDDFLYVVSHDDLETLEEVGRKTHMLVVDEAHHLSRQDDEAGAALFEMLSALCQRVPKLLLLSATPVLADERGFLKVLHLLDPVTFPLDDLEGFQRRIAARQVVAEIMAMLTPENLWALPPELDRLTAAYPDDVLLVSKVDALRAVLATFPAETDDAFLAALSALRTHLGECYRLHRRMLRNRRASVPWATIGREQARVVPFRSGSVSRLNLAMEGLRQALNAEEELPSKLAHDLLLAVLDTRGRNLIASLLACHGVCSAAVLEQAETLDLLRQRTRQDDGRFVALVNLVEALLQTPTLQIVVFCTHPSDADQAVKALARIAGKTALRHTVQEDEGADQDPAPWERFLTDPEHARVLVCDAQAEEGLNLHGGTKCAVHFDLPPNPNRLEQRLGRLDRFGKGRRVLSHVLVDEDEPLEAFWASILADGWQVFGQSVASLQYVIDNAMRDLAVAWLHHGPEAFEAQRVQLAGDDGLVRSELRRIDHQDALDSLEQVNEDVTTALEDCDEQWKRWRDAFRRFAVDALQFRWERDLDASPEAPDPITRLVYRGAQDNHPTAISASQFLAYFVPTADATPVPGRHPARRTHAFVFRRAHATRPEVCARHIHLLRVGDPIVRALERFARSDDRGRAFALWRTIPGYEAQDATGVDVLLRFDFVLRVNGTSPATAADHVRDRQLERLMAPLWIRVWVAANGEVLDSEPECLSMNYAPSTAGNIRDVELTPDRWPTLPQVVRATWMRDWTKLCMSLRGVAVQHAVGGQEVRAHQAQALEALARESGALEALAEARLARLSGAAREQEARDLEVQRSLRLDLEKALRTPHLILDVVGAHFVSALEFAE